MNKKLTGIFAMCALLLTGCQGAKESSKEITPPDTGWGKTVDEVLADWNLDRDQVEIFSETESAAAIAVDTEATVFGEQTGRRCGLCSYEQMEKCTDQLIEHCRNRTNLRTNSGYLIWTGCIPYDSYWMRHQWSSS